MRRSRSGCARTQLLRCLAMLVLTTRAGTACATTLLLVALSGCGDDTKIPQAVSATPFATSTVAITQRGNADATIDANSVSFKLDDSRWSSAPH
jgi:hypothetical protein